ncbi:MAG: hypothetical protein ACR2N9_03855 [Acidimicrobiia bacterium]
MASGRRGFEGGSALPLFTGLVFVAFIVLGLAIDIARAHGAFLETSIVADAASEGGAAMIDVAAVHSGLSQLDLAAAEDEARRIAGLHEPTVSDISVSGEIVCVEVAAVHRTLTLAFVGLRDIDIVVRSCSELRVG